MITKIFDTISKAIEKLRPSYALFFVMLLILHFSLNLYQNEFTEIMDNLSFNLFGNDKVLGLIDVIAFNCFFFFLLLSILASVCVLIVVMTKTICTTNLITTIRFAKHIVKRGVCAKYHL